MAIRKPKVSAREARRLADDHDIDANRPPRSVETKSPSPVVSTATKAPSRPSPATQKANSKPPLPKNEPAAVDTTKIQVYLSAIIPEEGVSPSFDMLSRQYRPGKALQMILRRALFEYDTVLKEHRFDKSPEDYKTAGGLESKQVSIQTSRMMPVKLVKIARDHFDPLGFESSRSFGRKLATAALATFFKRERKR